MSAVVVSTTVVGFPASVPVPKVIVTKGLVVTVSVSDSVVESGTTSVSVTDDVLVAETGSTSAVKLLITTN